MNREERCKVACSDGQVVKIFENRLTLFRVSVSIEPFRLPGVTDILEKGGSDLL
jgi:hypothetical protein